MLETCRPTLPASWYFDQDHYRREISTIWWRDWLLVERCDALEKPGAYRVFDVGGQKIIVTRTEDGSLKAFHNTCRHRGAELCATEQGVFPRGRIVCPYHAWTYSLDGELTGTPRAFLPDDFDAAAHHLYEVAVDDWGGFIFINLDSNPGPLVRTLADHVEDVANWPLTDLAVAHRERHRIACNWKVFWENFLECYHCPKIHRDLCNLVPVYGLAVVSPDDLPDGGRGKGLSGPSQLREGAVTWSADGETALPWFEGLGEAEKQRGMTFAGTSPSFFLVAHVDYVRTVRVLPVSPEETELTVDWLLDPSTLARGDVDIDALTGFGRQVVLEDAQVCEANQRGLHSIRHEQGTLVGQEYDLAAFHDWVMERLESGAPPRRA
jgi:Rieske 2Fe-2S family protein